MDRKVLVSLGLRATRCVIISPLMKALAMLFMLGVGVIGNALGEEERYFNIPQDNARITLKAYAKQSGRQILYPYGLVEGYITNAVLGSYTPDKALRLLLHNTGLDATSNRDGYLAIRVIKSNKKPGEEHVKKKFSLKSIALALLGVGAVDAIAEDNGAASSVRQLEEVIVTAQKREQRLSDVGLTIHAIGADQLKNAGITDASDLAMVTPGLNVGEAVGGYQVFSIRGINFNAPQFSAAPTVSAYIDEASLPYSGMWGGLLLDVERVEVLKGPQGTLFGQNATGGSINVIAAKPTEEFRAGAQLSYNEFGEVQTEGYVSGPLSETLRARLAATTTQGGAWQKGYVNSNRENGDQDKAAVRLLLDWTPTEDLSLMLNLNGSYDKGEPQAQQYYSYHPQNPLASNPDVVNFPQPNDARDAEFDAAGRNPFMDNYTWQAALRVDWDFSEHARLTSITNFVKSRFNTFYDFDGTPVSIVAAEYLGRGETFTEELRLSGELMDASLHYIVGATYQDDDLYDGQPFEAFDLYSSLPPNSRLFNEYPQTNKSYGVFANLDFEVVSGLTLTGGVRYTKSRQTAKGCTAGNAGITGVIEFVSSVLRANDGLPPPPAGSFLPNECFSINDTGANPDYLPASVDLDQTEDNVSWRAGINYEPTEDILIYALASRGYKAGVFPIGNIIVNSQMEPVTQEELTSYEVGVKATLLDRRVNVGLSAFHYDYKDKQFFTYKPNSVLGATSVLVNIPESEADGIDAEIMASFGRLDLHAGVTYIDTEVGDYVGFDINLNVVDFTGNRFNYAPELSSTFGATYHLPFTDELEGSIGIDGMYSGSTNSDLNYSDDLKIPSYTVFNARFEIESVNGWRAQLWVRNLTDKYYWTNTLAPGDTSARSTGRPRTYGITVGYEF